MIKKIGQVSARLRLGHHIGSQSTSGENKLIIAPKAHLEESATDEEAGGAL